ncbi:hypothetical protein PI124_g24436, partial [Phytophthora idaei]
MVTLFCAIVGVVGSAFSVRVDENNSVDELKKAIKDQSDGLITDPWPKLQLFLAKKGDGGWLPSNDPDVVAMRSGAVSEMVQNLLNVQIDPAEEIADVFVPA